MKKVTFVHMLHKVMSCLVSCNACTPCTLDTLCKATYVCKNTQIRSLRQRKSAHQKSARLSQTAESEHENKQGQLSLIPIKHVLYFQPHSIQDYWEVCVKTRCLQRPTFEIFLGQLLKMTC